MHLDEIHRRIDQEFKPFVMRTSDGREFPVPYRDSIMLTKRSIVVADEEGFVDILDPLRISSLKELGKLQLLSIHFRRFLSCLCRRGLGI